MPEANIFPIIQSLENDILRINSMNIGWFKKLEEIVKVVVPKIEDLCQGWPGTDKKKLAMEIANDILDKYVRIKWIPRWLINMALSRAIDALVKYFNDKGIFKHAS